VGGLALLAGVGGDLVLESSADSLEKSLSPLGCVRRETVSSDR